MKRALSGTLEAPSKLLYDLTLYVDTRAFIDQASSQWLQGQEAASSPNV